LLYVLKGHCYDPISDDRDKADDFTHLLSLNDSSYSSWTSSIVVSDDRIRQHTAPKLKSHESCGELGVPAWHVPRLSVLFCLISNIGAIYMVKVSREDATLAQNPLPSHVILLNIYHLIGSSPLILLQTCSN
jgi:hypothetical protein